MILPLPSKEPKIWKIVGLDTEDNSKGHVTLLDVCWKDGGAFQHFTTESPAECLAFMRKEFGKMRDVNFVAHNLEYDLGNLFKHEGFQSIKMMSYSAKLISAEIEGFKGRWTDSFNFYAGTLKKMGEIVGIEKGKMDVHSLAYVRGDTEILVEFMERFQDTCLDDGIGMGITIGGQAIKSWRTHHLDRPYMPWNEEPALSAYFGGRCELFWKGEIQGDITCADVNSMYPFAMTKEYPDTGTIEKRKGIDRRFGIADCTIFVPSTIKIPPLPVRTDGQLLFPTGMLRGWWTYHEIRNATKRGCEVRMVHESYGTDEGCYPFLTYIHETYGKRLEAREAGNDFLSTYFKLKANNSYGKLAQHLPRLEIRNEPMGKKELKKTGAVLEKRLGHLWQYRIPLLEPPEYANYLWGTYVTSYARIHLDQILNALNGVPGLQVLYCDTDSAMVCGTIPDGVLDLDEFRLGAMKVEKYVSADFRIPKGYVLVDAEGKVKVACKGVPLPRDFDKSLVGTSKNPQIQFLFDGYTKVEKPTRFRQGLAFHKEVNEWAPRPKSNTCEYERRLGDGETRPQVVTMKTNVYHRKLAPKKRVSKEPKEPENV
jgi:hypothetical protein